MKNNTFAFILFSLNIFFKRVFWKGRKMSNKPKLVESVFYTSGTTFEEIFKASIENYLKNFSSLNRQTIVNFVELK